MTYKSDVYGTFCGQGGSSGKVTGTMMLGAAFDALTVDFVSAEVDLLALIFCPCYFNKENIRSIQVTYHA